MRRHLIRYGFSFLACLVGVETHAQTVTRTSYFVENSTHRHLMNPALTPVRGYIGFPGAGELYLGLESNMNFTHFLYPANETSEGKLRTFLHPSINADDFLSGLGGDQYLRTDLRTSLFSFGYHSGKSSFITFDVASRTNLSLNLPEGLFGFLKKGMSSTAGNTYHLDNLSIGASTFAEAALGYSTDLSDRLRVGIKAKYLIGLGKLSANMNQFTLHMTPDEWSVNTQGQLDIYGKGISFEKDEEGNINGVAMDQGNLGLGGSGYAIDLGFTYSPIKNLNLSLAAVDLGGIRWNKDNIRSATSTGAFQFKGIEGYNPDSLGQEALDDQLNGMKDDLMTLTHFKEQSSTASFFDKLHPTVNVGLEYSLKRISIGGLMSTRFTDNDRYTEYTASLNLKPVSWFNLSGSYSFLYGERETFGVALGFTPGPLNVFVACDYVPTRFSPQYIPLNTLTTNFQVGVSLALGKRHTVKATETEEEEAPEEMADPDSENEDNLFIVE